jgi:hypothetical protein
VGKLGTSPQEPISMLRKVLAATMLVLLTQQRAPLFQAECQAAELSSAQADIRGEWKGENAFGNRVYFSFGQTNGITGNCRTDLVSGRLEVWKAVGMTYTNNVIKGWLEHSSRTNFTIGIYFCGKFKGESCKMRFEFADAAKEFVLHRSPHAKANKLRKPAVP